MAEAQPFRGLAAGLADCVLFFTLETVPSAVASFMPGNVPAYFGPQVYFPAMNTYMPPFPQHLVMANRPPSHIDLLNFYPGNLLIVISCVPERNAICVH